MGKPTRICSIDGCCKERFARGWCQMHYRRWKTHGTVGGPKPERARYAPGTRCSVEDCAQPVSGRGWCGAHYANWYETGDPLARHRKRAYTDPEESFAARTEWKGLCMVWTGTIAANGYGRMWNDGSSVAAHRYAWERENGPIPEVVEIDHICHNRKCVTVEHLRLSSRAQNMRNLGGASASNRVGARNVTRTPHGKYAVRVTKFGVTHYFGAYEVLSEAVAVAERERARLFGEFAGKG